MTHPHRRHVLGAGLGATLALAAAPRAGARSTARSPGEQEELPGRTPHTRFAVNVETWWRERPLLERVRAAAALGFPAVELWPHADKDVPALAALCRELGIAVAQFTAWGFRPGLNDPANHEAFLRAVEQACDVAQELGARHATVVGGDDRAGVSRAEMHAHIVTALRRAAPLAEVRGLTLILEPMNVRVDHPGHCLYGSADALAICRAVGSTHVKLNWDLYHMQISEGDLCGHLAEGIDQIGYVQLADHPGRHEPGTGEIHYPRVLRALHELGYEGFVGLECWPRTSELEAARAVARADRW